MNNITLPPRTLAYLENGAPKGSRNDELLNAACQFRDAGYSEAEAIEKLIGRATADGLSSNEILSTIRSAFSRAPREPARGGDIQNGPKRLIYRKIVVEAQRLPSSMQDAAIRFLETKFSAGEFVAIGEGYEKKNGQITMAITSGTVRTRETWIADITLRGMDGVFPFMDGLFVRVNPMRDATGCTDKDVAVYRDILIESDEGKLEDQLGAILKIGLPISAIVYSGDRSVQAHVRIDAPDEATYRERFALLRQYCVEALALKIDLKNINPSRYSRFPGAKRTRRDHDTKEKILGENGNPIIDEQTLLGISQPGKPWNDWVRTLPVEGQEEPYQPKGNSPTGYSKKGITQDDILLGDGFLEREGAALLAGPSGIGKSSVAMQMGCCWACGKPAFHFVPPKQIRIVMMQHEDSQNDLVRQSAIVDWLGLNKTLIDQNFWIETVRGQIGASAVKIMRDLVTWWRADVLLLNPLTAYHDGDISQNKDNVRFLYGDLGKLLSDLRIALFAFHHKGKPPRRGNRNTQEDVYHDIMYEVLGGSVLTNFFRGIITVSPIANSVVYKFTVAKRFEQSGWTTTTQQYKWADDRTKRIWVPASVAETENARKGSAKTLEDLYKLVPPIGSMPRESFERTVIEAGFSRRDYRGLLAQALDDSTPDNVRLYQWSVYNPLGLAKASISRFSQPSDETHQAIREAKAQERKAKKTKTGEDQAL